MTEKPTSRFSLPKGFRDMLPGTHEYFTYIKKVVRHRCRQSGFRRISTPILEQKEIFEKGLGENDKLLKKFYSLEDPDGNALALKAEGFSGIIRAYIEHAMKHWPQPVELYFIEPFFRYEPARKNHLCQFHQFGAVVIGENDAALSAQMIQLAYKILQDLGLEALYTLQMNTVGCFDCRGKYIVELQNFYFGKERSLCENCIEFLEVNPMRLLDCHEEDCQILVQISPKFEPFICKECKKIHQQLLGYLDELSIPYEENPNLVRSLDYYNGNVFEFVQVNDGTDTTVCGGGRMDGIVEALGGDAGVPVFGLAMGIERLIDSMKKEKIRVPSKDDIHVLVAQLGQIAKKKCLSLIDQLREEGIKTVGALGKGSMGEQIALATKFQVPYMVIIGVTEVREKTVIIRDMKAGKQKIIPANEAVSELINLLGENTLDKYSPGEVLY